MAIIANENKGYTQDEFKDYLKTTIDAIVPQVSELETSAEQSATDSASSATSAANSAKQSATSAANSEAANQQSKKWASATESPDGAVDTDSPTGKTQSSRSWALYSKDRSDSAASSATASANSATEAATHEANAKQSLVASQNIQKEVEDGLKKVSSVVTYRGTVDSFTSLPTGLTSDNTGDMYNIKNAGGTDSSGNEIKAGDNVVWNGSGWDDQSGHVDLSDYYTKEEIGKSVLSVVANNDTLTFIHRDATKDSLTINNVGHATKASQDGNGNNIVTTYETQASHASDINSINNTINTKCLSSLTVTDASITATTVDGTKSTVTVNNVAHAGKASQDDKGQAIDTTYATKLEVKSKENNIIRSFAALPVCYMRDSCFGGTKTILTAPSHLYVNVGNLGFIQESSSTIDISKTAAWDNSIYATAANRKGKDFYIYACQTDTSVPKIILSANSTVPTGYTATNSRKVGGFHCECADVGTISGHPLSGYVAGDILPASVWDLRHRPISSPEGMVFDGRRWIDIYLASWDGSKLVSAYNGVICDGESSPKFHGELFVERFAEIGKHLPSREDFMHFAKGIEEGVNISGSKDYNTTGGHVTTSGRRMISNYGIEEPTGYMWQWGSDLLESMSSSHSGNNRYMDGYDWSDLSVYNSDIDSTKRGSCFGFLRRVLFGGGWGDGARCGSRSSSCCSFSAPRLGGSGARGASEPLAPEI